MGPFQTPIVIEELHGFRGERQEAQFLAFAPHAQLRFGKQHVVLIQTQHFGGAQSLQKHQAHNGQVPCRAEAGPKTRHLLHGQRDEVAFGHSHSQPAHCGPRPAHAQRSAPQISLLKAASPRVGGVGELVAKSAIGHRDTVIDGGTGKGRLVAALKLQVVEERRLRQVAFHHVTGVMKALPPANKVQQAVSAATQTSVGQAADILAVQETIDPANLPAAFVLDHAKRTLSWVGGLRADDVEPHDRASSRREWNCRASPPWTKKELGSWPGGRRTRRGAMPCARRRWANPCAACAATVGIDIEGEINSARAVAQLAKLVEGKMGAQATGGVAETCLPQHREIEQAFDQNHAGELANRFPGDQVALGAGEESMGEGAAGAAAVQVDDASVLVAGEDDALVEGVVALGVDEAGAPQEIEGIALGEEVTPQAPARRITDLQFPDQGGVAQSALLQIPLCLRVALELLLVESGRPREHGGRVSGRSALLLEIGQALAKRQVLRQLDEANEIAALAAAVAVEEILAGVDIEGRPGLWVQRTESNEFEAVTRRPGGPILLSQVIEQRKSLFELFEILAHGAVLAPGDEPRRRWAAFPGKDGG